MINQPLTKTRPDDVLGNLSEDDQDRILDWLEHISYREVLKRIAEPAPEGFGLNIHYNTLRKFHLKNLPMRLHIHRHDEALEWKTLADQSAFQPIDFQNLIRESLERQVMISLNETEPNNRESVQLLECLLRWRNQELAKETRAVDLSRRYRSVRLRQKLPPPQSSSHGLNNLEQP